MYSLCRKSHDHSSGSDAAFARDLRQLAQRRLRATRRRPEPTAPANSYSLLSSPTTEGRELSFQLALSGRSEMLRFRPDL